MLARNSRYMSSNRTSMSARRRARDRRDAELIRTEGEQIAWEKQQLKIRQKLETQRQARAELSSYEPWGKAGGGAPNLSGVRYTKLRTGEIYPEDELRGVIQNETSRPRRRMRRTPLRLHEDPQICYGDACKNTVDNDLRYRTTPDQQKHYKQDLDDLVERRNRDIREEHKRETEYDVMMGWTDNEIFDTMKGDHGRYKSTSLTLPDVKKGDVSNTNKPSSVGKLPQIKQSSDDNRQDKTKDNSAQKQNRAPRNGSIFTNTKTRENSRRKGRFVKRLPNGDRIKRHVPEELPMKLERSEVNKKGKNVTPEEAILRMTGGIELVPLLARRRRVGARTLPSSDVTRPQEQFCQWREMLNMDYLKELKNQVKVKYQQQEVKRQDSAESVRLHHDTWASLWGRPGHGAPQERGRYARHNLTKLLYAAPVAYREII